MNLKKNIAYSWRISWKQGSGWKLKAYTSFTPYYYIKLYLQYKQ